MRWTGHIRERSSGSYELRYSMGTYPATGKRKMATVTVRGSRKYADKELRPPLHRLYLSSLRGAFGAAGDEGEPQ